MSRRLGRRDDVVLATKFAVRHTENGKSVLIDGHPDYVAAACEASLRRLGIDAIDLYYAHRLDPTVPVEETVGAMGRLVDQAKCAPWASAKSLSASCDWRMPHIP